MGQLAVVLSPLLDANKLRALSSADIDRVLDSARSITVGDANDQNAIDQAIRNLEREVGYDSTDIAKNEVKLNEARRNDPVRFALGRYRTIQEFVDRTKHDRWTEGAAKLGLWVVREVLGHSSQRELGLRAADYRTALQAMSGGSARQLGTELKKLAEGIASDERLLATKKSALDELKATRNGGEVLGIPTDATRKAENEVVGDIEGSFNSTVAAEIKEERALLEEYSVVLRGMVERELARDPAFVRNRTARDKVSAAQDARRQALQSLNAAVTELTNVKRITTLEVQLPELQRTAEAAEARLGEAKSEARVFDGLLANYRAAEQNLRDAESARAAGTPGDPVLEATYQAALARFESEKTRAELVLPLADAAAQKIGQAQRAFDAADRTLRDVQSQLEVARRVRPTMAGANQKFAKALESLELYKRELDACGYRSTFAIQAVAAFDSNSWRFSTLPGFTDAELTRTLDTLGTLAGRLEAHEETAQRTLRALNGQINAAIDQGVRKAMS